MKKSLKSRYQLLLLIFFVIFVLESGLIFLSLARSANADQLRADVYSIVIMFIFIQFVYFLIIFYYIPYKYEQAYKEIFQLMQEITEGRYQFDLDLKTHQQSEEVKNLMTGMHKMMNIITKFDSLKAEKIYEHHQRIQMLINMIPQGCLIITIIGEIVYINDFVKREFPALSENLNILETLLPEDIEDGLKPIMIESIKTGNNLHDKKIDIKSIKTSYKLNSSIIRNRKGQPIGAIFTIVSA